MARITKTALKQMGSLFEPAEPQGVPPMIAETMPTAPRDPNACPQCGKPSLKSIRAMEYGGRDRYCAQCPGDEAGEPLRWRSE